MFNLYMLVRSFNNFLGGVLISFYFREQIKTSIFMQKHDDHDHEENKPLTLNFIIVSSLK